MGVFKVLITPDLIQTMLTTGYEFQDKTKVEQGLPEGSILVGIGMEVGVICWMLFLHPDVQDGSILDLKFVKVVEPVVPAEPVQEETQG